jgi:hypothetical protein
MFYKLNRARLEEGEGEVELDGGELADAADAKNKSENPATDKNSVADQGSDIRSTNDKKKTDEQREKQGKLSAKTKRD